LLAWVALGGCVPSQRADDVVVLASGADLESGNPLVTNHPLSRQIQRYALFVTLTRYDSLLAPQPYYAQRWRWSEDRRSLELALASDLAWHDGVPTTAQDVSFTYLAARDPATGYARASELAAIDTVLAVDDTTVRILFSSARAELPAFVSELPIVPRHRLGAVPRAAMRSAAFNDSPMGNGPFVFASRTRGARWSFTRNDRFPASLGGAPGLRGIVVAVVDEATTKFAGLASGELDMAGIAPSMAALAERDATLRVLTYPVLFGTGLFFNTTRPPFDDERVRRAVSRSLDRARIVEVALAGFGRPSSGPIPPDSPLALESAVIGVRHADSLLDASGWRRGPDGVRARQGRRFEIELLTVGSGDNVTEQLVQADLAARGIALRVRQTEMGSFLTTARASRKQFDLLLAGIPGDLSFSYVSALFDSAQRGGSLDYTGYHSSTLDSLLAATRTSASAAARRDAWHGAQRAIDSLAPATWLFHSRGVQGVSRRVRGVRMDLRGELVSVHQWRMNGDSRSASR
jgi:peptide/nickel transport system substrate-binding protein